MTCRPTGMGPAEETRRRVCKKKGGERANALKKERGHRNCPPGGRLESKSAGKELVLRKIARTAGTSLSKKGKGDCSRAQGKKKGPLRSRGVNKGKDTPEKEHHDRKPPSGPTRRVLHGKRGGGGGAAIAQQREKKKTIGRQVRRRKERKHSSRNFARGRKGRGEGVHPPEKGASPWSSRKKEKKNAYICGKEKKGGGGHQIHSRGGRASPLKRGTSRHNRGGEKRTHLGREKKNNIPS